MNITNNKHSRRLIAMFTSLFVSVCSLYTFNINAYAKVGRNDVATDTYNHNGANPSGSTSGGSSTSSKSSSSGKSSSSSDKGIDYYMGKIENRTDEVLEYVDSSYLNYSINWTTVYNQLNKVKDKVKKKETDGVIIIKDYEEYVHYTFRLEGNKQVWYWQKVIKPAIVARYSFAKSYDTKSSPKVVKYNWYMTGPEKRNCSTTSNTTKVIFTKEGTYNTDSVPYVTWTVTTYDQFKITFDAVFNTTTYNFTSGNRGYYTYHEPFKSASKSYATSTRTDSGEDWSKVQKFQTIVRVQDLNKQVTLTDTIVKEGAGFMSI